MLILLDQIGNHAPPFTRLPRICQHDLAEVGGEDEVEPGDLLASTRSLIIKIPCRRIPKPPLNRRPLRPQPSASRTFSASAYGNGSISFRESSFFAPCSPAS